MIQLGTTKLSNNKSDNFELLCKINLSKSLFVFNYNVIFIKDGYYVSDFSKIFDSYISYNETNIHKYLRFNFKDNANISVFNGNYSCNIYLQSQDLGKSVSYSSQFTYIEFDKNIETTYNVSNGLIALPKLPGIKLELVCKAVAYPFPKIEWIRDDSKLPTIFEHQMNDSQSFTANFISQELHAVSIVYLLLYIQHICCVCEKKLYLFFI